MASSILADAIATLRTLYPWLDVILNGGRVLILVRERRTDDEQIAGFQWISRSCIFTERRLFHYISPYPWPVMSIRCLYAFWTAFCSRVCADNRLVEFVLQGDVFEWKDLDSNVLKESTPQECIVNQLNFEQFSDEDLIKACQLMPIFKESLRSIQLNPTYMCPLHFETLRVFFEHVIGLTNLEALRLTDVTLNEDLITVFANGVKDNAIRLRVLLLQNLKISVVPFAGLLMLFDSSLKKLELAGCKLEGGEATSLISALPCSLETLIISRTKFKDNQGFRAIVDELQRCRSLQTLEFSYSNLDESSLEYLASALIESGHLIHTISVMYRRSRGGLPKLSEALRKTNLRRVNLYCYHDEVVGERIRQLVRGLKYSLITDFALRHGSIVAQRHCQFVKSKAFNAVFALCSAKQSRVGKRSPIRMLSIELIALIAVALLPKNIYGAAFE